MQTEKAKLKFEEKIKLIQEKYGVTREEVDEEIVNYTIRTCRRLMRQNNSRSSVKNKK